MVARITGEQATALLEAATPGPCPTCKGRGVIMRYPADSRLCDKCNASGETRGNETVRALASTVIAQAAELDEVAAELARVNGYLARLLDAALGERPSAWTEDEVTAAVGAVAELRATLAAERGDPAGALPGWCWDGEDWTSDRGAHWPMVKPGKIVYHVAVGVWSWRSGDVHGEAVTARDAMRAADAAGRNPPADP